MIRALQYFIAGIFIWLRMGIPFWEAMRSAKEASDIMRDVEDDK